MSDRVKPISSLRMLQLKMAIQFLCAIVMICLAVTPLTPTEASSAKITCSNSCLTAQVDGSIHRGDAQKLYDHLRKNVETNLISLTSRGGSIVEAMKMERVIRHLSFDNRGRSAGSNEYRVSG